MPAIIYIAYYWVTKLKLLQTSGLQIVIEIFGIIIATSIIGLIGLKILRTKKEKFYENTTI